VQSLELHKPNHGFLRCENTLHSYK